MTLINALSIDISNTDVGKHGLQQFFNAIKDRYLLVTGITGN